MGKVEFSGIGKQITMRADLSEFSSRDRLNLMQQLMSDFGLLDKLLADPAAKPALELINACIQENW